MYQTKKWSKEHSKGNKTEPENVATTCIERGWTQAEYQNKHCNINQKFEGTQDERERDGWTNFILRIKEKKTRLTLQEHDDDVDDGNKFVIFVTLRISNFGVINI